MEKDVLHFDPQDYQTVTISCAGHEVLCKAYLGLPYAAKPVDPDYQSLHIYIPLTVDGVELNTNGAPVIFQNMCNGYNSFRLLNAPPRRPFPRFPAPANPPKVGPAPGVEGGRSLNRDKMYLPLTEGFLLVIAGNRGRDNFDGETYFGKAPASIVDMKAAVRYLRHNRDRLPGNTEHIVSVGASAGGGSSALLAASGNDPDYEPYLKEIGAADERDDVFAAVCISPVLDLEHQDACYEWQYGKRKRTTMNGEVLPPVDQTLSGILSAQYEEYLRHLDLNCRDGYGKLTPESYRQYYLHELLIPAAEKWLSEQDEATVQDYLSDRPWLHWDGKHADFQFEDYEEYLGRLKGLAAFDTFAFGRAENTLFGSARESAAHFTEFSLRYATGDANAVVSDFVLNQRDLMNPMVRLREHDGDVARHWWIRMATKECGFASPLVVNLAAQLDKMDKDVNFRMVWDGGHCAEDDRGEQMQWIRELAKDENWPCL